MWLGGSRIRIGRLRTNREGERQGRGNREVHRSGASRVSGSRRIRGDLPSASLVVQGVHGRKRPGSLAWKLVSADGCVARYMAPKWVRPPRAVCNLKRLRPPLRIVAALLPWIAAEGHVARALEKSLVLIAGSTRSTCTLAGAPLAGLRCAGAQSPAPQYFWSSRAP
jgi:hypothetical protein